MSAIRKDEVTIVDRDRVRHIELNRPQTRNGLTVATNQAMIDAIESAADDSGIRVLLISGAGDNFCSGLDLKEAMRQGPQSPEVNAANLDRYFHGLIRALVASPCPTIAAMDGSAVGFGADLALACDLRIMSKRARFSELFVRRGLIPDGGSSYHLPRLIGVSQALELMFTGDMVDAQRARELGLCNRVVPADRLIDEAWSLAAKIARGAPLAMRLIKQNVRASLGGTLDEALARERAGQILCLQSRDFMEGVAAFLGKREPKFTGE